MENQTTINQNNSIKELFARVQAILADVRNTNGRPFYIYRAYKNHMIAIGKSLIKQEQIAMAAKGTISIYLGALYKDFEAEEQKLLRKI